MFFYVNKTMQKILKTENYTMIFSDPDIILHLPSVDTSFLYMAGAEEFARDFFSGGIISKKYRKEKDLTKTKYWLVGILYHERKNSVPEVLRVTGYKGLQSTHGIITSFGPARNNVEATKLAFQKKFGKTMPEVFRDGMKKKWDNDKYGTFRDKISKTSSDGCKKYWNEKRSEP